MILRKSEPNVVNTTDKPLDKDVSRPTSDHRERQRAELRAKIEAGRRAMKNKKIPQVTNEDDQFYESKYKAAKLPDQMNHKIVIDADHKNVKASTENSVSPDFLEHLSRLEKEDPLDDDTGLAIDLPPPPPVHVAGDNDRLQMIAETRDGSDKVAFVISDATLRQGYATSESEAAGLDIGLEENASADDVVPTESEGKGIDYERMILQLKHIMSDEILNSEASSSSSDDDSSRSTSGDDKTLKKEEDLISIRAQDIAAVIEHQHLKENTQDFSTMLYEYLDSSELQNGLEHLIMSHGLDASWHTLEKDKPFEAYLMHLYGTDEVTMHQKTLCRLASLFQRIRQKIEQ